MVVYQNDDDKLYTIDKWIKNNFPRRRLMLIFSVFLFSLLVSYSSGFSCFLHSFNLYYSTFLFSLIAHSLERKYMFLICNGIVAFLAGFSGFGSSSSPGSGLNGEYLKRNEDGRGSAELSDMKPLVVAKEVTVEGTIGSLEDNSAPVFKEEQYPEQEREDQALIAEDGEREYESMFSIPEAAEDEAEEVKDEEEEEFTSTEELNKKFEDFIRRMKEELRVQAQHQLISV